MADPLLSWHEGTHGWREHDGYRRHAHSLNGALTIDPHSTRLHFKGAEFDPPPAREQVRAHARMLADELTTQPGFKGPALAYEVIGKLIETAPEKTLDALRAVLDPDKENKPGQQ